MELDLQPIKLQGVSEERPLVIAGPCSAETEEQVMTTATALAKNGIKIFRAGIWKPRTKPGGFEGVGEPGLEWMKRVKAETGMYVTTEVANSKHVEAALKAGIDLLWIGARTSANPFAGEESCKPRLGTVDWSHGTTEQCWHQAFGCHTSWLHLQREENLS